jgi:hypothetical protein
MLEEYSDLSDTEMLAIASAFDVLVDPQTKRTVRVELRFNNLNWVGTYWVIINESKFLLNHEGTWEYEPLLKGDHEFFARTCWDNAHSAIQAALQEAHKHGDEQHYPAPINAPPVSERKVDGGENGGKENSADS